MSSSSRASSCTPVLNLMTPFIEGKLSPDEERIVWQHIDACKTCLADFQNSLFLTHLLKDNMALPEPPPEFAHTVLKVMNRQKVGA